MSENPKQSPKRKLFEAMLGDIPRKTKKPETQKPVNTGLQNNSNTELQETVNADLQTSGNTQTQEDVITVTQEINKFQAKGDLYVMIADISTANLPRKVLLILQEIFR